nr:PREDICTED: DNA cross-link repair protein pso2/snm1 isoform X1 [Musa acuminata subsp. malaccensis]
MASKPNLRTLTLTMAMSEEDDDDFQNPSEAFSIAQNRIVSSMKDPCLRTLKSSTGARPRKRPRKLASAEGKENLEDAEYIAVCTSVPSTLCVGEERMRAERRNSSLDSGPGSLETSISTSDCRIHFERDPVVHFDGVSGVEKEKSFLLTSVDPKVVKSGGNEGDGSRISEGTYYSRSIESRLLESRAKPVSNIDEGGCLRVDDWEDFDAGTQLNELMNLCCEMDDGGSSHGGASLEANEVDGETAELKQGGLVECPLCGIDITDISDELRQIHTNNCLDKVETLEVADPISEMKSNASEGVVDISPVTQWLQSLGLSKYKDIFVKEEINWETLQCLTEEDAFRYLRGDCSHWFLTHFHMDHYQGLNKNFYHGKIYCSSITAHLVNMKIGVPWDRLQILPLNQKITVAGVGLTCFDANHCPGSIIILFEPPNGKAVLHTGDFRFSREMANNAVLQSCHIHTLILDTTYCNPQYDFPKQEAVAQFVIEAIQAEAFNPKTLFLIGSYTIGKERLYLEVAQILRQKIYVGAAKLQLLRHLELAEEEMQWFTANEMESHIHVVPLWTLASFKRMRYISNQYSARYDLIVAFSPTGWACGKGKKRTPGKRWQQGTMIRYEVPYSEHCSFTELKEFVRLVTPEHIIPSVNNDGPESADAMIALLMSES